MASGRFFKFFFLVFFVCCSVIFTSSSSVYAGGVKKMASFSISGWSQGATLTQKYYVYTDWSGGSFKVIRCERASNGSCKKSSSLSGKPSSLYHKWGSDKIQAILKENSGMHCLNLQMKTSSGCGSMVKSNGLNISGDTKSLRQGWTKYDNVYLRGYGNNGGMTNYIWLFNSSKKLKKKWAIPLSGGEVEDVMVDGDTGEVYFTYGFSHSRVVYYKVDKSVFSKWIKPLGSASSSDSDSGSSSSGGSGNRGKNPYINREPKDPIADIAEKADTNGVMSTNFFGNLQDDGKGCGVWLIINIVLTVLTFGVITAATVGMLISASTYMTAKDSPEKVVKAKKRILDIIIGLFMYAAMWSILEWLLPGGILNTGEICKPASTTTSTSFSPNNSNDRTT